MNRVKIIALILVILLLSTSCWSRREIDQLGFVLGIGFSKTETGLYIIVAQVANPAAIVAEGSAPRDVYTIMEAEGLTIFDALRNLSKVAGRRLYIAHVQSIVIDEALAKDGLGELVGFLVQDMEVRIEPQVFISKIDPREIFDTPNTLGVIPSIVLETLAKNYGANSKVFVNDLHKTVEAVNNPVINYITSLVEKQPSVTDKEYPYLELTSIAVFNDDKLVGYLDLEEGQAYNFITDKFKNGLIVFECGETADLYTIEILSSTSKITPKYNRGKIEFDILLTVEGNVAERISIREQAHEADMEKLQNQLNQVLTDKLTKTINAAQQEFKVDIFNLSKDFSIKHPKEFNNIKAEWNAAFSNAKINVKVESTIIHSALNINRGRI